MLHVNQTPVSWLKNLQRSPSSSLSKHLFINFQPLIQGQVPEAEVQKNTLTSLSSSFWGILKCSPASEDTVYNPSTDFWVFIQGGHNWNKGGWPGSISIRCPNHLSLFLSLDGWTDRWTFVNKCGEAEILLSSSPHSQV